jgi:hypothetical protein
MAWRGLVAHGWKPVARDEAVTAFVRGSSTAAPPFPEPRRSDVLFCEGWFPQDVSGRQMSSSHASFWAHGPGIMRLFVLSPEPLPVRISVDGHLHSHPTVEKLEEVRIGLPSATWHLVAFDAAKLPEVRGKPRGVRIVAYALP